MKFRAYERPDGRSTGQPEVLVCHDTIEKLGFPAVDYDALEDLSAKIINNPSTRHPRIKIRDIDDKLYGYYPIRSYTLHADAVKSEQAFRGGSGVVSVVAHELQHYADFKNRPIGTHVRHTLEPLAHTGLVLANSLARRALSDIPEAPTLYEYSGLENRARRQQQHENTEPYEQAILFPESVRTANLLFDGQLSESTIAKLGLSRHKRHASDYVSPLSALRNKLGL